VDLRWPYFKSQTGRRKDLSADIASGCKHERLRGKPKNHGSRHWMPTSLAQKPHDRGCRFFNRPTRDINGGPIVSCAKSPRKRNFLGDGGLVDVLIVIAVRF